MSKKCMQEGVDYESIAIRIMLKAAMRRLAAEKQAEIGLEKIDEAG